MKTTREELLRTNKTLRLDNGLYVAATGEHYRNYVWIRDTFYQVRQHLYHNEEMYTQTYHSLLDYLHHIEHNYNGKITNIINKGRGAVNSHEFIHPRFYSDLNEITPEWGNVQLDTLGYLLLGIADGIKAGYKIIRHDADKDMIYKLISVIDSINYHDCQDQGIWEENTEVHTSSVGAILGGLKAIQTVGYHVPQHLIDNGQKVINNSFFRESKTKCTDLALITLIYPFNVLNEEQTRIVIFNCIRVLQKEHGFARYVGDAYYNIANHDDAVRYGRFHDSQKFKYEGNEAEWCFGFTFIALALKHTGCNAIANEYVDLALNTVTKNNEVPELYYSETDTPNDNTPLGWATAMLILALDEMK
jgi:phosphorylase kinase alpha/beta subunit